jgi:hypothetical protein
VPLTYASPPRMTNREVMVVVTPKSTGQDRSLSHYAGRSVGSEPESAQVPRGNVPARGRSVVASRIGFGAGTSRDGQ